MPSFFKKRFTKGKNAAKESQLYSGTPSASTLTSTEQSDVAIERIDWALQISNIIKDISEGSHLLAPLKAASALIIRCLEITRNSKRDAEEHKAICSSLEQQLDAMESLVSKLEEDNRSADPTLHQAFRKYLESLQEVMTEVTSQRKSPSLKPFGFLLPNHPTNKDPESFAVLRKRNNGAFDEFLTTALSVMAVEVAELVEMSVAVYKQFSSAAEEIQPQESTEAGEFHTIPSRELDFLPSAPEHNHDNPTSRLLYGLDVPLCEPGTRVAILDSIRHWADGESEEKLYWLKDAAGTGKTTVAATLAAGWLAGKRLAGRFFFTPNSISSSGIDQFCVTVARDLAKQVPSLNKVIETAMRDAAKLGFHQQFKVLVADPIQSLELENPIILVIDALDNCDPDGRQALLSCLLEYLTGINHVKVLLTSRPNPDIVDFLSGSHLVRGKEVQLLDIHDTTLEDVRIYVHSALKRLTIDQREQVVGYSGGLFIVAATACRLLKWNAQPAKLLSKLIDVNTKDHLDELYLEVLRQAVADPTAHDIMMNILQIIIITFQPVSINTIRASLREKVEVDPFVQDLGAVLKDGSPDRPIKVLHPTFREFLAEANRCNGFIVDEISSHNITAIGCFSVLDKWLNDDILQLRQAYHLLPRNSDVRDLDKRITAATTAAVRYASSYWSFHVAAAPQDAETWRMALQFLDRKLLNWVELMSLRGSLVDCMQGLSQLRLRTVNALRMRQPMLDKGGAAKVSQSYCFLLQHQAMIQESALHIYSSALAFTPHNSIFDAYRRIYSSRLPRIIGTTPILWSARDILAGHTTLIRQVEFSSDGTRLATRSDDSLILWDPASGAIVGRPFNEQQEMVCSLAYSPDGQKLAFATESSKIYVWNSSNGMQTTSVIDAGPGKMVQIAFSPTRPYIISASKEPIYSKSRSNNNIRLWSTVDNSRVGTIMLPEGGARCFAVSPDSLRLACVSKRGDEWHAAGITTLWDLETFLPVSRYTMPIVYDIHCVIYSPTGDQFVTWDQPGTLYIHNGRSGVEIAHIKRHNAGVHAAHFSPSGGLLAAYWKQEPTIYLLDPITGGLKFSLSGHADTIAYVSFAQDGVRLASASIDQTIRVWDTLSGGCMESFFNGYTGNVIYPTLSADWSRLVMVSASHQINLHDVDAGTMQGGDAMEYISLNFAAPHVAFSPRGDVMVCGYYDLNDTSTLGLWSLQAGTRVGVPMVGHEGGIIDVSFSHDAQHVASLSLDNTVRIWDGSTGQPIGEALPMHNPSRVIFSSDSRFFAASSYGIIKVWNVHTRECVWTAKHKNYGDMFAFSSNSSQIAGTTGNRLCIWEFLSGSTVPVGSTADPWHCEFTALTFDPTDSLLATYSGHKVQLWTIGAHIQLLCDFLAEASQGYQLGISNDGRFLAYGSLVWDISSPECAIPLDTPKEVVPPLDWRSFPHSLLTYDKGWIYSGWPPGPLMPVPRDLWEAFEDWHAYGQKMVVWTQQRLPIVVDCQPLLM